MRKNELPIKLLIAVMLFGAGCSRDNCTHDHGDVACDHGNETAQAAPCSGSCDHEATACGQDHAGDHGHAGETCTGEHTAANLAFEVPERAQRLLGLSFVTAAPRRVTGTVRFPGRFEWMPGARRVYAAAVRGAVELHVRPPQQVNVGDRLFTLSSPEWTEKNGLVRESEAVLAQVRSELAALSNRLSRVHETGVRNADLEQQFAVKEAEAERADRARENAMSYLSAVLSFCRETDGVLLFEAREAGLVERVSVENGAWVESGAEIVRVARADGLWFRADGVLSEMAEVRTGQVGFVEPLGQGHAAAVYGTVELGLSADGTARMQPVCLVLPPPPPWALPGSAGVLSVVTAENVPENVAVPLSCIVRDGLRSIVFVRDAKDQERFSACEVELGANDGDWAEVKGLESGTIAVMKGAHELKLALPAQGTQQRAAGHFHADGQFHEGKH